jgi:hypothetical protein
MGDFDQGAIRSTVVNLGKHVGSQVSPRNQFDPDRLIFVDMPKRMKVLYRAGSIFGNVN